MSSDAAELVLRIGERVGGDARERVVLVKRVVPGAAREEQLGSPPAAQRPRRPVLWDIRVGPHHAR